jgi:murein DD-endopeptidase MepM/ murein hydrolase activator NlpD
VTVAAVAVGAAIAAGESLVAAARPAALAVSAVLPVAGATPGESEGSLTGVGGDQPLPETLTMADLDAGSQIDIQNSPRPWTSDANSHGKRRSSRRHCGRGAGCGPRGWPRIRAARGALTSAAGPRWGGEHYGLGIANRIGTPIFAVTDGVVVEPGPASGFGRWVVLRHPDGTRSV